jgi:hypothetical protein
MRAEPATKKQKLSPTPPETQDSQSSFADVLARIQLDAQGSTRAFLALIDMHARSLNHATRLESEGGADSWDRPRLKHLDRARDKIGAEPFPRACTVETNVPTVFQQLDIDGSYDNLQAGPQINVFGVTQVRRSCPSGAFLSTHLLLRQGGTQRAYTCYRIHALLLHSCAKGL